MQKMVVNSVLHAAILIASVMLIGCASAKQRPDRTLQDLVAAREADDLVRAEETRQFMQRLVARVGTKVDAPAKSASARTQPTIDILVISGGGDWGAFGAGVLKGWGRVTGEFARPHFDVVTGVSTGALIAPFAFLGDEASIDGILQMYRNPQEDWAKRGFVFFWPSNPS
jgi:hypothetical protein